ncbi:hypothetical protein [Stenotrophomonas maltophilia]|uniref:hypothetical protein n=1 Tax=Stenotrophomonas maltophilia TaxID=40324 RepID=UPI002E7786BF|nr:hypothetical protein [Stenotrophomonas maltophilia]
MSTDKTLANVQPGGRVRLGDALLPCPLCGNDAEFVPYKNNGLTLKCKSMGCIQRHQRTLRYGIEWLRTSMTEHWNTRALSAQPSPGGQAAHCPVKHCGMTYARVPSDGRCHACGATVQPSPGGQGAPRCAEHCQNGFADICLASQRDGVICPEDSCDIDDGIRHNHLAARQPVDMSNVIEQIAQQWDGCSYDAVGEPIDIGQAIRAAGKRLDLIDSHGASNG